jgi:hypothetical protein
LIYRSQIQITRGANQRRANASAFLHSVLPSTTGMPRAGKTVRRLVSQRKAERYRDCQMNIKESFGRALMTGRADVLSLNVRLSLSSSKWETARGSHLLYQVLSRRAVSVGLTVVN